MPMVCCCVGDSASAKAFLTGKSSAPVTEDGGAGAGAGAGGGGAAATPSEGQEDGGAAAAVAEQQPAEEEPSCSCLKQKPKMKTWPSRHIRIQGKSLMVYDDEESSERAKALLGAEAERERRQTSILDLTGCGVTMGKEHFMLAVRPHNIHFSALSSVC